MNHLGSRRDDLLGWEMVKPVARTRTRLKPEDRVVQILDAAAILVVEQGIFPIPLETLSQRIGVSKGLIYSYFPTQFDLALRLLQVHLSRIIESGLEMALADADLDEAARRSGDLYYEHVATHGPLLHILLSDAYLSRRLASGPMEIYRKLMGRAARRIRAAHGLSSKESIAAANMLAAIPEELGNLSFLGRLDRGLGHEVCAEMVLGGLHGLEAMNVPQQVQRDAPEPRP